MSKLSCWLIDDPSLFENTKHLKGNCYGFLFEYVDAMCQNKVLAQYLEENVLVNWGTSCFDLIAQTIKDRSGHQALDAEDVRTAFAECKPISEFTQ